MPITSVRSGQILDLTILDSDVAPAAGLQSSKLDLSAISQPVKLSSTSPQLALRKTDTPLPGGLWRVRLIPANDDFRIERNTAVAGDFSTVDGPLGLGASLVNVFGKLVINSGTSSDAFIQFLGLTDTTNPANRSLFVQASDNSRIKWKDAAGVVHTLVHSDEALTNPVTSPTGLRLEAVDPRLEFRDTNIALPNGSWRIGLGVNFDNIFDIEQNTAAAGDFSARTLRLRLTNTGVLLGPVRIDAEQFHFTSFVPVSGVQGDSLFASDTDFRLHYKKGGADKVVAFREEIGDRGFVTTISANTSLSLNAHDVVLVNAAAAPITISLPTAVGSAGKTYSIKKIDASGNTVTIDPDLSETIDGSATRVLTVQHESVTIVGDGANWRVID